MPHTHMRRAHRNAHSRASLDAGSPFFLSFPPFSCCLFWSTGGPFPQCCCSHGYRRGDSEWGLEGVVSLMESGRDSVALFEEIGDYVTVEEAGVKRGGVG